MNAEPLLASKVELHDITALSNELAIRAYQDGFQAALIAVNNAALGASDDAYRVVCRAIQQAEQRLAEHLDMALDSETLYR